MDSLINKGIDKYIVHSYEVDASQKLKVSSLLKFFQESAGRHAESIGVGWNYLHEKGLFWALSRISIEIDDRPEWEDEIALVTWPKVNDNVFAYRDFLLFNSKDLCNPIVRATSAWALLNIKTRRPQRIELVASDIPLTSTDHAIVEHPHKVDALSGTACNQAAGQVKYSDIDMNGHVNNVRYFDWIGDAYPYGHYLEKSIARLDINFLNEALLGDTYRVNMDAIGGDVYLNNVVREKDNKELVRTRISWIKR